MCEQGLTIIPKIHDSINSNEYHSVSRQRGILTEQFYHSKENGHLKYFFSYFPTCLPQVLCRSLRVNNSLSKQKMFYLRIEYINRSRLFFVHSIKMNHYQYT